MGDTQDTKGEEKKLEVKKAATINSGPMQLIAGEPDQ